MSIYMKATALALAITAAGATGALAGKTTTPNPPSPPVVTTVVTGLNLTTGSGGGFIQSLIQSLE